MDLRRQRSGRNASGPDRITAAPYVMPLKLNARSGIRFGRAGAIAWLLALLWPQPAAADPASLGSASGLPVPRFVSLKSDKVNVRGGPTKDHEVAWIYTRSALPVEITAEFDNWRRIRDWEGAEGWVYHSLLSGRRTAIAAASPKTGDKLIALHDKPDAEAAVAAQLQPGVLGQVKKCSGTWCRIVGNGFDGWIQQERLWGVYPGEKVE
jgi:SH3-like domain-containing protein